MSGALDRELRKELAKGACSARRIAEAGAGAALGALRVGAGAPDASMSGRQRALRERLRAHGRALGDRRRGAEQEITRLAHEVAYEHWHRMLFARFLAENGLLIEPESGVAVSLDECRELARDRNEELWAMVSGFAERMLPRIFRPDDPSLAVQLAPETQQALERTLGNLPPAVFRADDALGWTYQYWQTDRKDEVNRSEAKIGADELPAVTQLFTERYMVRFLFHNTVGAWRAAKLLAVRPELAGSAVEEAELRDAARFHGAGGYGFDYLRFVREPRDGEEENAGAGPWRPAAGSFEKWPRRAADLKVLDPCCGSGHFLVEGLHLFVRLRMEEENLPVEEAIRAVLRDNLHGLELDPRCAQIAAFAVALAAWKLAGRVIELPPLQLACSGLAPHATKAEWLALAGEDPLAGAGPRTDHYGRPVFAARESLLSSGQRQTLGALHDLFVEAPTLGSLIDPRAAGRMFAAGFGFVQPLLERALAREDADPERRERAVAAAGMARAAALLAESYTLVITNVPYLARGRQDAALRAFAETNYRTSKGDLATMFVERAFGWLGEHGAQAFVVPQNWLFLTTYRKLREDLLTRRRWRFVARLGPGAFETIGGHVVNAAMTILSADAPDERAPFAGLDVSAPGGQPPIPAPEKARLLLTAEAHVLRQQDQTQNPDARLTLKVIGGGMRLDSYGNGFVGMIANDAPSSVRTFWELRDGTADFGTPWVFQQGTVRETTAYGGRERVLRWDESGVEGFMQTYGFRGRTMWKKRGVVVSQMGDLPVTLYTGERFDNSAGVIGPLAENELPAVWEFCSSPEYARAVRELDQMLKVTNATLVQVPFEIERWRRVAAESYPNGLPEPYTDDPTQWIFHGHPCGSVIWDEDAKRTAEGPARFDATVLQIAVTRLLGYRWPAESDPEMRLADEAHALVRRCAPLESFADDDGIVCLPAVRGEARAADRLRELLATACGDEWSATAEQRLLRAAADRGTPSESLDAWLRDHFFAEHCRLFHHRPFVWHVWDGLPGGFAALVNYHRLAAPDGGGRKTLESLTHSYLGDWIQRQRASVRDQVPGAEVRLEAALDLEARLAAILAGEPPLDLFVRWKPLPKQPVGWEPDINDGVRLNIRPFLRAELRRGRRGAGVLRARPNIHWKKDRGREPQHLKPKRKGDPPEEYRPKPDFPWFWSCPGDGSESERSDFKGRAAFDGARWNDLYYTNAAKRAARERQPDDA